VGNASLSNVYRDQVDLERVFLKEPWEAPSAVQIKAAVWWRGPTRELGLPPAVLGMCAKEVTLVLPLNSQLRFYAESCIWQGQAGIYHVKDHLTSYPRTKVSGEQMASSKCSDMEACEPTKQTRSVPGALSGWPPKDSQVDLEGSQTRRRRPVLRCFSFRN
jgi:hypothetical protein